MTKNRRSPMLAARGAVRQRPVTALYLAVVSAVLAAVATLDAATPLL